MTLLSSATPADCRTTAKHKYTITLYALSSPLDALPMTDDIATDWTAMITAMDGKIIDSSYFSFMSTSLF
ncbi:hypothetical protein N9850_06140 [Granulosicoccus sp.]|nr:hypothetical protein [Granulosicoccus sp.]MDB4223333.1 hypothetical protein [Granulosicoccus sp.]